MSDIKAVYSNIVESFIKWLRAHDLDAEYFFMPADQCLITRFFESSGGRFAGISPETAQACWYLDATGKTVVRSYSHPLMKMAQGRPRTYRAALTRAETYLEGAGAL